MHKPQPALTPPPPPPPQSRTGLDSQPFSQAQPPPQQHNTTTLAATMSRTSVTQRNHQSPHTGVTAARCLSAALFLLLSLGFTTSAHAQPGVTAAATNDDRTQTTLTFSETVVLNTTGTPDSDDADDWTITQTGATPATITPTAISIPIATATGTTTVTLTHPVLSSAATAYRLSYSRGDNEIITADSQPIAMAPIGITSVLLHIPDGNVDVAFARDDGSDFAIGNASVAFLASTAAIIQRDDQLPTETVKDQILGFLGLTALDGTTNDVPDDRAEIIGWLTGLGITFSRCSRPASGVNACLLNDSIELADISGANGIPIVLPPGLTFSSTSLTVDEGDTTTYTVVLDAAPTDDVTVTPTSGNADAATVSSALTFTDSNWNTAQTITVTGVDDAIDNTSDRTATITHAASGGGYGAVTGDVGVTTTDDDADGLSFTPGSVNVGEASTVDYTVVLNTQPSGNVTVTPTSSNLAAATVSPATLTFTDSNWNTAQTVTVTGVDDANSAAETFDITHAASGGGYGAVTGDVGVTTTDDDADGLSFTPGSVNVGEASTVDYSVVLNTEPSGNVTVTPTSENTDAATVSGALTFTMTNWDTAQTVTVTGVDDDNSASEIFDITHAASGGGYDAVTGDVDVTTTDDDAPVTDNAQLNETVLPQVTQAVVRHTQGTVARRVGQVASGAKTLTIAGQSSLSAALGNVLSTQAAAINAGSLKDLLGNTDFVLPLHAASAKASGQGGSGVASSLVLWGGGEYRSLSDDEVGPDTLDWDGDLFSATLGIDANLRNNILLGVAGSWSDVDVDYRQGNTQAGGDYSLSLVGVHPYLAWTGKRLSWWFTGGYGDGELSISDEVNENSSDVTLLSLGTGASGVLWADQLTTLRLKGDILWAEMDVEGGDDISRYTTDVNGSRLLLEASQVHSLDGGVSLEPSLELGVRYDGGDGDDRTNMELGAGLRLHGNRLTLDGSVYALLGEDNLGDWDIREWGVRGLLHLQGGRDGEGLSFSLTPGYGAPERDALLWNNGHANSDGNASNLLDTQGNHYREYTMRLDTELGYGIPAGQGMLSPYGQMTLGDGQRYRLGLRWSRTELFELELEGERRQRDSQGDGGNADNAILLQGRLRF